MDGFHVTHMVYKELIYIYFSTNSYAFSLRISYMYICILLCIGFYKMLIKLLIIVLLLLLLLLLLKKHLIYLELVVLCKYTDDNHCTSRHSTCICVQHQA